MKLNTHKHKYYNKVYSTNHRVIHRWTPLVVQSLVKNPWYITHKEKGIYWA